MTFGPPRARRPAPMVTDYPAAADESADEPVGTCMTLSTSGPTTAALADLVRGVRDDQLGDPTPCPDYTVARPAGPHRRAGAGVHAVGAQGGHPRRRQPVGGRLQAGGRMAGPDRRPAGRAGRGVERPGGVRRHDAGRARSSCRRRSPPWSRIDEVTVHAWDLAAATGQRVRRGPGGRRGRPRLRGELRAARGRSRRRRRPVRPAGPGPGRRPRPRPAARRDRSRPPLEPPDCTRVQFGGLSLRRVHSRRWRVRAA